MLSLTRTAHQISAFDVTFPLGHRLDVQPSSLMIYSTINNIPAIES